MSGLFHVQIGTILPPEAPGTTKMPPIDADAQCASAGTKILLVHGLVRSETAVLCQNFTDFRAFLSGLGDLTVLPYNPGSSTDVLIGLLPCGFCFFFRISAAQGQFYSAINNTEWLKIDVNSESPPRSLKET